MVSVTTDRRLGLAGDKGLKVPVKAATTGNITLSGEQTIDAVAVVSGDRVLVKNQTVTTDNGFWDVATGAWTRSIDANGNYDLVKGTIALVTDGGQAGQFWQLTTANPIYPGTTALAFALSLTASMSTLSFTQTGTGAVSRTALSKLREVVSVADFGAVGDGVTDDTAAFTLAQAAQAHLYVPASFTCSVQAGLNYWQFWGPGRVFEPGLEWSLGRVPQSENLVKIYRQRTFGNYESAVADSVSINYPATAQQRTNTQILGTSTQGMASTYNDRDHVARYTQASTFEPDVTSAATTYTSNTLVDSTVSTLAAAGSLVRGMIIDTKHATPYTGRIQSWSGTTITVDAWYQRTTGTAGTPANGTGAIINPNTKIWGQNTNIFVNGSSTNNQAQKGTGYELGISCSAAPGVNIWGFDAVTLSGKPDIHYQSRGSRTYGFYGSSQADYCYVSNANAVGFEARDSLSYSYQVTAASVRKWSIDASGTLCHDFRKIRATTANSSIADDDTVVLLAAAVTFTLPNAAGNTGRCVSVKALAGGSTINTGGGNIVPPGSAAGAATWAPGNGAQATFVSDGAAWYAFNG